MNIYIIRIYVINVMNPNTRALDVPTFWCVNTKSVSVPFTGSSLVGLPTINNEAYIMHE